MAGTPAAHRPAPRGFVEVFVGQLAGTPVAVKVLLGVDAAGRRRFLREVATMAALRHPNLLLFMGFVCRPAPAIVTEFMHRGSLFGMLAEARRRAGCDGGAGGAPGAEPPPPPPPPRLARAVAAAWRAGWPTSTRAARRCCTATSSRPTCSSTRTGR
jgi:hypothetical protein